MRVVQLALIVAAFKSHAVFHTCHPSLTLRMTNWQLFVQDDTEYWQYYGYATRTYLVAFILS